MSGLCAVVHFDTPRSTDEALKRMTAAAGHRAVDGSDAWSEGGVAIGHLRLNVTPHDERERQPFVSRDGRYVVAADARVDARDDLVASLRRSGVSVRADAGNAELLLTAYRFWGRQCISNVLGDYAFIIWDSVERRCTAGRDAMSMRPLYYRADGARLLIASEVGQILAVSGVERSLDEAAAAAWLNVRAGDPARTFIKGIHAVVGGHILEADARAVRAVKVWDLDPHRRIRHRDERAYAEQFRDVLLKSARSRMQSRHPAGIFQSGGLDSVAAAAASGWILRNDPPDPSWPSVTAYAYRFEHFPECDERLISAPLADHFGFRHEEVSSDVLIARSALDGPWDESGPVVGMYSALHEEVLRRAREAGIRQMYTGARGDNMMGAFIWDHLGLLLEGSVAEAAREIRRYRDAYAVGTIEALRRTVVRSAVSEVTGRSAAVSSLLDRWRRLRARPVATDAGAAPWLMPRVAVAAGEDGMADIRPSESGWYGARLERYRAIHDAFTLQGNIASAQRYARHGIQYEDLWSDRSIAEYAAAIPQHILNRINDTKRLGRMALEGILPDHIRRDARKIIPAREGTYALRKHAGRLSTFSTKMLLAEMGWVDEKSLHAHVERFVLEGELDPAAWCALTLEGWMREKMT